MKREEVRIRTRVKQLRGSAIACVSVDDDYDGDDDRRTAAESEQINVRSGARRDIVIGYIRRWS